MVKSVTTEISNEGGSAAYIKLNVTSEADWKKGLEFAIGKFGGLNILVNNAGWTYPVNDTLKVTEEEYDRMSMLKFMNAGVLTLCSQVSSIST